MKLEKNGSVEESDNRKERKIMYSMSSCDVPITSHYPCSVLATSWW